jgi:RHS repeat-associated protein
LTDAKGATRTFGRDATGRERSFTDALGRTTRRTFDDSGNLVSVTEPSGATFRTEYNAVGDVTRRIGADASVVSFEYDAVGRRTGMTDATGTTRYGYDAAGRLLTVTQPDSSRFTMSYDAAGNRTSLQYPDGLKVSYRYDATNNMIGLDSKAGNAKYTLNPDGLLLNEKLPDGIEHRYSYSGDLLVRYEELRNGRHTRDTTLTRDSDGLITAQIDGNEKLEYRYDAADQLTAVRSGTHDVLGATYDEVGNRTSITRDGAETRLTYDAADQLVATDTDTHHVAYGYDPAGRLVEQTDGAQRRTIAYNGFGLPSVTTLTQGKKSETRHATYDGDDLLAALTTTTSDRDHPNHDRSTTTRYSWSATDEVPQLLTQDVTDHHASPSTADCRADADARPDRADANFVYGHTRTLADAWCGSAVFAQDAFGSAVRTDETSPWVQATEYDTFGHPADEDRDARSLGEPGRGDQPKFGYRSELALDNAVYLRARIYDTTTSRFTARDPLATRVGQTDIVSPYAYANNSPQDYVDPTGEFPIGIGQFLAPILDGLVAALRTTGLDCPEPSNSPDDYDKCFQGIPFPLKTRGGYKGVEWALNGAEGPLSELWYDRRRYEYAARAFVVNYLSEEYDNFVEEFWDIFDKGLNVDVDWEVGPRSGARQPGPNGDFFPHHGYIDLVTKEKNIYEVKRWENGKNVLAVELQLAEYEYFHYRDWGIVWEFGTELTDWADGFEVSRREGWFGRESTDVIVWGADAGHIYFDEEKNVDDKTRAKIKAKTKGSKGKIGGKGPKIRGRR